MIPRIVHQTWRDADIPEPLRSHAQSWRRHHPDWSYRLWTDADLAELVDSRYPDLAPIFHAYPKPIMRADLGRYLVLKSFGGVYADLDAEALRPWDELLAATRPVFFEEPATHAAEEFVQRRGFDRIVSNAIIASPADHPFWDALIDLLRLCRSARNPLDATGPFVLTAAIDRADPAIAPEIRPARLATLTDKAGAALPSEPGEAERPLADHRWAGTWWRDSQDWPAGLPDEPHRDRPRIERLRDRAARRRLEASLAAARALDPGAPAPTGDRVLVAVPVHDAAETLDGFLQTLETLDHPKRSLTLVFLDCGGAGASLRQVTAFVRRQGDQYASIALQGARIRPATDRRTRGARLARMRNRLLRRSLGYADWVLWLDADAVALPPSLIGDLIATGARVVQPNAVTEPGGPTVDTRCWLSERTLDDESMNPYRRDGLYLPPTGYDRLYPSDLHYRDRMALDSVGSKGLFVDASLFRAGVRFPEAPYRERIDTEGFGAILRDHGVAIAGLPNLEIGHAPARAALD